MTGSLSQTRGRPEPGRELDALIAEKVMGWTKVSGTVGIGLKPGGLPNNTISPEAPHA